MKTFRLIGMALFAVLMCVSFASCSSSDDDPTEENEEGVVTNEKNLIEIKITSNNESVDYTFSYDNNGHLISVYDGDIYQFSWGENSIVETEDDKTITYSLANGLIKGGETSNWDFDIAYNSSKQITAIIYSFLYSRDNEKETFSWENGKITKIVRDEIHRTDNLEITYGNQTCKGYNPLVGAMIYGDSYLTYAHPELIGLRQNQLPTKIIQKSTPKTQGTVTYDEVTELSYTLDNNGYIASCSIKENSTEKTWEGEKREYTRTYVYTFKWK